MLSDTVWTAITNAEGLFLLLLIFIPVIGVVVFSYYAARGQLSNISLGTLAFIVIFITIGFLIMLIMEIVFGKVKINDLTYSYFQTNFLHFIKFAIIAACLGGLSANIDKKKLGGFWN